MGAHPALVEVGELSVEALTVIVSDEQPDRFAHQTVMGTTHQLAHRRVRFADNPVSIGHHIAIGHHVEQLPIAFPFRFEMFPSSVQFCVLAPQLLDDHTEFAQHRLSHSACVTAQAGPFDQLVQPALQRTVLPIEPFPVESCAHREHHPSRTAVGSRADRPPTREAWAAIGRSGFATSPPRWVCIDPVSYLRSGETKRHRTIAHPHPSVDAVLIKC